MKKDSIKNWFKDLKSLIYYQYTDSLCMLPDKDSVRFPFYYIFYFMYVSFMSISIALIIIVIVIFFKDWREVFGEDRDD